MCFAQPANGRELNFIDKTSLQLLPLISSVTGLFIAMRCAAIHVNGELSWAQLFTVVVLTILSVGLYWLAVLIYAAVQISNQKSVHYKILQDHHTQIKKDAEGEQSATVAIQTEVGGIQLIQQEIVAEVEPPLQSVAVGVPPIQGSESEVMADDGAEKGAELAVLQPVLRRVTFTDPIVNNNFGVSTIADDLEFADKPARGSRRLPAGESAEIVLKSIPKIYLSYVDHCFKVGKFGFFKYDPKKIRYAAVRCIEDSYFITANFWGTRAAGENAWLFIAECCREDIGDFLGEMTSAAFACFADIKFDIDINMVDAAYLHSARFEECSICDGTMKFGTKLSVATFSKVAVEGNGGFDLRDCDEFHSMAFSQMTIDDTLKILAATKFPENPKHSLSIYVPCSEQFPNSNKLIQDVLVQSEHCHYGRIKIVSYVS
ncbi:MAG: hypothetical protein LBB38_03900 [Puniceicoccales bacterium]|jgi:hypothetical protein|nr:hypothetical protein [Puniceicoccales bacterium]